MSGRTVMIVLLALTSGGSAAIGVARYSKARLETPGETVGVVVAAKDIPRFTTMTADMMRVQQVAKDLAPGGAVTRIEDVVDRVNDGVLIKDELILEAKLTAKGSGRGMSSVIPKGMRAVTIQTPNVATGVAGFILPGNKVDVLFTLRNGNPNDEHGGGLTRTLIQHAEILAVDQRIDAPAENKVDTKELRSVTLLVTPDQAAEIDLAQHAGTLHLTLRNHQDTELYQTGTATLNGIKGTQPQLAQPPVPDERMKAMYQQAEELLRELAAKKKEMETSQATVEVAPAPTPKPQPPVAPPKIRTLRSGIPGQVFIEID